MKQWCNRLVVVAVAAVLALASPLSARAESPLPKFDPKDMVPLVHGPNWVDLDGDGRKDLVMKSRVTINSPHSMSFYSFHVWAGKPPVLPSESPFDLTEPQINWYAVSFPDRTPPLGAFTVNSYQGADCMMDDYRLVVTARKPGQKHRDATLIRAIRESGESFADPAPVTFIVYHLERGSTKALNEFAFIKTSEFTASKSYCSVINAFKAELGLPGGDPALEDYDYEPTNR